MALQDLDGLTDADGRLLINDVAGTVFAGIAFSF